MNPVRWWRSSIKLPKMHMVIRPRAKISIRLIAAASIGNAMNATGTVPFNGSNGTYWNAPIVYVSSDGKTAITQFGPDIFSLPISGGNVNDLIMRSALFRRFSRWEIADNHANRCW